MRNKTSHEKQLILATRNNMASELTAYLHLTPRCRQYILYDTNGIYVIYYIIIVGLHYLSAVRDSVYLVTRVRESCEHSV